jgi:hypothetical protein
MMMDDIQTVNGAVPRKKAGSQKKSRAPKSPA